MHTRAPFSPPHPHPQGFRLLLSTAGGFDADVAPFLAEFGRDVRDYVAGGHAALGQPHAGQRAGLHRVFAQVGANRGGGIGVDEGEGVFCVPALFHLSPATATLVCLIVFLGEG